MKLISPVRASILREPFQRVQSMGISPSKGLIVVIEPCTSMSSLSEELVVTKNGNVVSRYVWHVNSTELNHFYPSIFRCLFTHLFLLGFQPLLLVRASSLSQYASQPIKGQERARKALDRGRRCSLGCMKHAGPKRQGRKNVGRLDLGRVLPLPLISRTRYPRTSYFHMRRDPEIETRWKSVWRLHFLPRRNELLEDT